MSATQPFRCISVFKLQCMLCRDTQHATHARLGGIISCPSRSYTIKLNVGSISQRFLHNIGTGRQEHVKMRGSRKRRVRAQSWQRKLVQIRALPGDPLKICGVERVSHACLKAQAPQETTPSIPPNRRRNKIETFKHVPDSSLETGIYHPRCNTARRRHSFIPSNFAAEYFRTQESCCSGRW